MRLIDGDALMELYADRLTAVAERYSPDSSECGILSGAMKLLEIQPTIEERKTGKWIKEYWHSNNVRECSACHVTQSVTTYRGIVNFNFCPYCGADMRGEEHDDC